MFATSFHTEFMLISEQNLKLIVKGTRCLIKIKYFTIAIQWDPVHKELMWFTHLKHYQRSWMYFAISLAIPFY